MPGLIRNGKAVKKIYRGTTPLTSIRRGWRKIWQPGHDVLISDPVMTGGPLVNSNGPLYTDDIEKPPRGLPAIRLIRRDHTSTAIWPAAAGESYVITYMTKRISGSASMEAALWMTNAEGGRGTAWPQWAMRDPRYTSTVNTDLGDGWIGRYHYATIPATWTDVANARLYFQINQYDPHETHWLVSDVEVLRVIPT